MSAADRAPRGSTPLPDADEADRLEQTEDGVDRDRPPGRASHDPWSPEADVAEQAAPVAAVREDGDAASDADRVEPIDDAGYD